MFKPRTELRSKSSKSKHFQITKILNNKLELMKRYKIQGDCLK